MAAISITQLPAELADRLRLLAQNHSQDVEVEAIECLKQGLTQRERTENELRELQNFRETVSAATIPEAFVRDAIIESRP